MTFRHREEPITMVFREKTADHMEARSQSSVQPRAPGDSVVRIPRENYSYPAGLT